MVSLSRQLSGEEPGPSVPLAPVEDWLLELEETPLEPVLPLVVAAGGGEELAEEAAGSEAVVVDGLVVVNPTGWTETLVFLTGRRWWLTRR